MTALPARRAGQAALLAALLAVAPRPQAADEFSGADKLRALYSAEFRFTQDGLPVVPVAIAEGLGSVMVSVSTPGGLRLLPEGEGGSELRADDAWQLRAQNTTPAKLRYWTIVWRGSAAQGGEAADQAREWKERGEKARVFEQGTLFGVAGEVLDRRESLVCVGSFGTWDEADKAVERLSRKGKVSSSGVYTELVDRPHGTLEAVGMKSGVRVRNEGVLWFAANGDLPLHVEGQGPTSKAAGSYFGRVYVTLDRRGSIAVVNAVPEDRLLAGLVPAEIFPGAPDDALKAQAIAARGELLTKIGTRHAGDPFRLCSQTHCQVYSGAGRETPRTTAAVAATRGEVLFTADGKDLVDTVYSANCGGHTESSENVWPDMGAQASLRGHRDAAASPSDPFAAGVTDGNIARFLEEPPRSWCGVARLGAGERYRWTVTRSAADLERLLGSYKLGPVRSIEVLERGVSGRARAVRVTGAARSEVIRGELRIRQAFGGLRSSLFMVTMSGGSASFRGAGFGHGVGLCQTGSIGMAEAGKSYKQILQHYYPGSVLRKLW
jgi:stage II sporulation protein D